MSSWSSQRTVAAARKQHNDGCLTCSRVIAVGQPYLRVVQMDEEHSEPFVLRFHLTHDGRCGPKLGVSK